MDNFIFFRKCTDRAVPQLLWNRTWASECHGSSAQGKTWALTSLCHKPINQTFSSAEQCRARLPGRDYVLMEADIPSYHHQPTFRHGRVGACLTGRLAMRVQRIPLSHRQQQRRKFGLIQCRKIRASVTPDKLN